jgi:hypothetical protein
MILLGLSRRLTLPQIRYRGQIDDLPLQTYTDIWLLKHFSVRPRTVLKV